MTPVEPRVAIFSICNVPTFRTSEAGYWLAYGFEMHHFNCDVSPNVLVNNRFSLLIIVGDTARYLNALDCNIPKLYVDDVKQLNGSMIYDYYIRSSLEDTNPIISVFSPAYKSFDRFLRAHRGMVAQSFTNWEWIILDDSPDDKNYEFMKKVVGDDYRIKIYRANRPDGLVGSTKRQSASLCSGKYLVELDHDDELHHLAFDTIVDAFKKFPDAGFCYTNCAETFEDGGSVNYGEGYGLGHGRHFPYHYKGKFLNGSDTPINANTVRHIVGMPNHIRCWEKDLYFKINRHNNKLAVVDDYEILLRTFLNTKMIHIRSCLYIQYMNSGGNNTQEPRRAEIQRIVDRTQAYYDKQIHQRILELGGVDWCWDETSQTSHINKQPPPELKFSTLAYVY